MEKSSDMDSMRKRARRLAANLLETGRDGEGPSPAELYPRDPVAAAATADAIMARIGGPAVVRARTFRPAYALAAALALAAVSSLLTLALSGNRNVVEVHFTLAAPEAGSVALAADFNDWSVESHELSRAADGSWEITVSLERGKAYRYSFVIDGERWIPDPNAAVFMDDGFGGGNSSLSL